MSVDLVCEKCSDLNELSPERPPSTSSLENNHETESSSDSSNSSDKRNLIVNYLPQQMTETEVKALFSTVGEIDSIKLIKSKLSKQSLGYAFIKYKTSEDAVNCVNKLNKIRLGSKTIKVSFARPSRPEIKDANLYVGGLPMNCDESQLERLFSSYGEIVSCRAIKSNYENCDYNFGFVRFDTRKQAENALEYLNGKVPPNNIMPGASLPISVKFAKTPESFADSDMKSFLKTLMSEGEISSKENAVTVSKLSENHDVQALTSQMKSIALETENKALMYGGRVQRNYINAIRNSTDHAVNQIPNHSILSNKVEQNIHSNDPLYYYYKQQQQQCLNNCHGENLVGTSLSTSNSSCSDQSPSSANLLITNLPADVSELLIYRICSKFGAITNVGVYSDDGNAYYAIVSMVYVSDAAEAAEKLNGLVLKQFSSIKARVIKN